MTDRPEPAVRRPRPDARLRGRHEFVQAEFRDHPEGGVCQWCGNIRVRGVVNVHGSFINRRMVRTILVVSVLALVASCYAAWRSHRAESSVDALRVELTHKGG